MRPKQQPDPATLQLLFGNAPHVSLRGMLGPGQTGAAGQNVGLPPTRAAARRPGQPNLGVTSSQRDRRLPALLGVGRRLQPGHRDAADPGPARRSPEVDGDAGADRGSGGRDGPRRTRGCAQTIRDAHLFDSLKEHDGWKRLAELVRVDRERFLTKLAKRLMAGEEVSQREIDFHRGFYQGAEWVVGHPENAEASLERAARAAWRMAQKEMDQRTAEADSAYTR